MKIFHKNLLVLFLITASLNCLSCDRDKYAVYSYNPELKAPVYEETVKLYRLPQGLFLTDVKVNGHTAYFLLDTGCTDTCVSSNLINRLGLKSWSVKNPGGNIASDKIKLAHIKTLTLSNIDLHNFDVNVFNLDHLEKTLKTDIDGIIGNNVLNKFVYSIDFSTALLTINPSNTGRDATGIKLYDSKDGLINIHAELNGHLTVFMIDTGSNNCFINRSLFDIIFPDSRLPRTRIEVTDIARMDEVTVRSVKVDELHIDDNIFNNAIFFEGKDNILGNRIFDKYILTVDSANNMAYLKYTGR